jgi:multidrug transporter EmrE-like cation transporter
MANFLWFSVAKKMIDKELLYVYGFYWNSIVICTYALVPIVLFGVRPQPLTIVGIGLIIAGILVTRMST